MEALRAHLRMVLYVVLPIVLAWIVAMAFGGCTPASASPFVHPVASISGRMLENIASLPDGSYAVSDLDRGLRHVNADGSENSMLAELPQMGAVVYRSGEVIFATGNSGDPAMAGERSGVIHAIDIETGEYRIVADGLVAPNGLAVLPSGELLYTTALGPFMGVHRVGDPTLANVNAGFIPTPNGLTVGPDGLVYVASTGGMQVYALNPVTGDSWPVNGLRPGSGLTTPLDDLTAMPNGMLYAASEVGIVWRIDPRSGVVAPHATDPQLIGASSVKPDGSDGLVVTTFGGLVVHLSL